ncbi:MAG: hypothetical protein IJ303_03930 [Clostridia bacterium]|nr:hypothetical protein [Clostridia bacterium]
MAKRIVSMLLVVMMLLTAVMFASCGKKTDNDTTDGADQTGNGKLDTLDKYLDTYDPEATAESYVEDLEKTYDFEGHEFTFLNSNPVYFMYIYLDPDMTGDVLDDCCFERNLLAEDKFNITISEETQPYTDLAAYAKTMIYADEDAYDAMYIPASMLTPLISENLFYDLLEIEELNVDKIWWHQPGIQRNIIEGRLYYATSDLNLMAFESAWGIYFNEEMMYNLGLDEPFDMVFDGKWTFDKMKEYCSAAACLNGDSTYVFDVNGKARYGLVNFGNAAYMAYGMGAESVTRDTNERYHFTADTDRHFMNVWNELIDFYGPDNGLQLTASAIELAADGYFTVFESNRSLFLHAELKGATVLREWEGIFAVLPQPKFDAKQEAYNSNILSSCLSFCIPVTNGNTERTGIIVDYLTYESYRSLLPRYFDIHVCLKSLWRQESIDVLALIRGTLGCEAAVPYGWAGDLNSKLSELAKTNSKALDSTISAYKDRVISNINNTYAEYPTK